MPLPSILAAKLSKRGLLTQIASKIQEKEIKEFKGATYCPNKNNIYHECTLWCQTHWKVHATPDPKYAHNMKIMLEKYPLPHNWAEVFDKGIGCYYFWNMETNLVSWLPPRHPKSKSTESAAKLRMRMHSRLKEEDTEHERIRKKLSKHDRRDRDRDGEERKRKHEDKDRYKKRQRKDDLDPMDPAAYSDIPKGSWSDGLENNKGKADSTASGPLFQQRPYPAPGDVLASNSKLKKKK